MLETTRVLVKTQANRQVGLILPGYARIFMHTHSYPGKEIQMEPLSVPMHESWDQGGAGGTSPGPRSSFGFSSQQHPGR